MATCFIHAGTHKTATTYLQTFLVQNQELLEQQGLYVPRAGRHGPLTGHHRLAQQLNGWDGSAAGSFDGRGLEELRRELAPLTLHNVCLTAENFGPLHAKPAALQALASTLHDLHLDIKVIVYLRPQVDYGESLYLTLLNHGLTLGFDEFWQPFGRGCFVFSGRGGPARFATNYSRLLRAYAVVFGRRNIVARRYHPGTDPRDILEDFLPQMLPAWKLTDGDYRIPPERANATMPVVDHLQLLIRNNLPGTDATEGDVAAYVARHAAALAGRFEPLSLGQIVSAWARLTPAAMRVRAEHGVFVPVASRRRLATAVAAMSPSGSARRKALVELFRRPLPFPVR